MNNSFQNGQHERGESDASSSTAALVNALEAFANAPTFEATRIVLEEQKTILLSLDALTTVQLMLDDLFAHNQNAEAENWRQYLRVLSHATVDGIDTAWNYFIEQQLNAKQAIEALTTAATMQILFQAVNDYQHILLSDAAIVMLRDTIQRQHSHAPPEALDYWKSLLHLLEDMRERELTAAWQAFVTRQEQS